MKETWDLLVELTGAPGDWQMAVDEAMMGYVRRSGRPLLRLYRFVPRALSLGRGQTVDDVYLPGVREIGAEVVRRPSGGKAVLHDEELTYAFASPDALFPRSVEESYRMIAGALLRAVRRLGVDATFAPSHETGSGLAANCFIHPSVHEITVGGRKAIGSAQVRRRGALLQHGAIPVHLDFAAWSACFAPPEARSVWERAMRERSTGLFQEAASPPSFEVLAEALVEGFQEHFGVALEHLEEAAPLRRLALQAGRPANEERRGPTETFGSDRERRDDGGRTP